MPDLPAFHGWTHRPKKQGGTDPIPDRPWCKAYYEGSQSVTSSTQVELRLDLFQTNRKDVFALDTDSTTNPSGILVKQWGLYQINAFAEGADDEGNLYLQGQPSSSYPVFGDEDDPTILPNAFPFHLSILQRTNQVVKMSIRTMFPDADDPIRVILAAQVPSGGSDYSVSTSTIVIQKIGDFA